MSDRLGAPQRRRSKRDACARTWPRILFLSSHLPWPPISGGRRRELELIKRLTERHDVHLIVVSKTFAQDRRHLAALQPLCCDIELYPAEPLTEIGGPPRCRSVAQHRSTKATGRVGELLSQGMADLVHVEGFYLMQHVPPWTSVPVLLVEQNIEYELERQRVLASGEEAFELSAFEQCMLTHDQELESWRRATQLATVTGEDREVIERELPGREVAIVPDGADHLPHLRVVDPGAGERRSEPPEIALVANFAYPPNVDAALYLTDQILPRIHAQVPDVRLSLVGNSPPPEVMALRSERVTVTGTVPDVLPHLDRADVIVCPLRIGGGIRVKSIEALRRAKAFVTTSIGAQGLDAAREALVIADDPFSFADAVVDLLADPARRRELERRAAVAASRLTSWEQAAQELEQLYARMLAHSAAREPVLVGVSRSSA